MTQIVIAPARLHAFMHVYEVRPRKDRRGVDLISDVLPFGRLRDAQQPFTWDCDSRLR